MMIARGTRGDEAGSAAVVAARLWPLLGVLCLAAITLISGSALASEPPIAADPGDTRSATLRYAYRAGEDLRYRVTVEERARVSEVTSSQQRELHLSANLLMVLQVQREEAEGGVVLVEEVREPRFSLNADGLGLSQRELAQSLSGVTRTLALSARGQALDEEVQTGPLDPFVSALAFDYQRPGETLRFELPERELSIGDGWAIEDTVSGQGQRFDRQRGWSLELIGWANVRGRRCALLEVSGDGWLELDAEVEVAGLVGPALARGVVHGHVYFDPVAGRVVQAHFEVGTAGQATGTTTPRDLTARATWTIELVE